MSRSSDDSLSESPFLTHPHFSENPCSYLFSPSVDITCKKSATFPDALHWMAKICTDMSWYHSRYERKNNPTKMFTPTYQQLTQVSPVWTCPHCSHPSRRIAIQVNDAAQLQHISFRPSLALPHSHLVAQISTTNPIYRPNADWSPSLYLLPFQSLYPPITPSQQHKPPTDDPQRIHIPHRTWFSPNRRRP